ncbi:MAG: hypothetical protein HQK81_15115 [Desulfovibrionaceae bacterium]|nr:hypothetical protein [Desulfovibrionaceae bacterium]MBF0515373.1 hypothetical protein [Desulfovibrionaceae bacterium]
MEKNLVDGECGRRLDSGAKQTSATRAPSLAEIGKNLKAYSDPPRGDAPGIFLDGRRGHGYKPDFRERAEVVELVDTPS